MAMLDRIFKAPAPQQAETVLALAFSRKPNAALAVPAGMAPPETHKMVILESGTYSGTPQELVSAVEAALKAEEDVTDRANFGSTGGAVFTVRTALMRYPDLCYLSFEPAADGANLAMMLYSHSHYGHSDLGANGKRLTRVLEALAPRLASAI